MPVSTAKVYIGTQLVELRFIRGLDRKHHDEVSLEVKEEGNWRRVGFEPNLDIRIVTK